MSEPISGEGRAWRRWMRLAAEALFAAALIVAPLWDGVTTIPPR